MPPDVVDRQLVDDFEALVLWLDHYQAQQAAGGD
jgi:hypothetical protein